MQTYEYTLHVKNDLFEIKFRLKKHSYNFKNYYIALIQYFSNKRLMKPTASNSV